MKHNTEILQLCYQHIGGILSKLKSKSHTTFVSVLEVHPHMLAIPRNVTVKTHSKGGTNGVNNNLNLLTQAIFNENCTTTYKHNNGNISDNKENEDTIDGTLYSGELPVDFTPC